MRSVITNKYGPNTTILLPGTCNANCDFCFWNRDEGKIKAPDFIEDAAEILKILPPAFKTLSISGGEPTISPVFGKFLARLSKIRRERPFERVVLTSNGTNLKPFIHAIGSCVDHINISRHAIGTAENGKIFRTKQIPSDTDLVEIILEIHSETQCDVTMNCVVAEDVTTEFCLDFIEYTKALGADAVSFRKVASTAEPTEAEKAFRLYYGTVSETKCPICRGATQLVDGFDVRWKGSVDEPSIETDGVYEIVIHPDGKAYVDWGMKFPVAIEMPTVDSKHEHTHRPTPSCGSGGGCGSKTSGC